MKNFILISPNFPVTYWQFAKALKEVGFRVLAIGDSSYDSLVQELKDNITEYYKVNSLESYEEMFKAVAFFSFKYGHIDYLESNNEHWLRQDSKLREDFNIEGKKYSEIDMYQSKSLEKRYYKKAGVKTARYALPKTIRSAKRFINIVGYPVIVKPDIGVGASSTTKIKSEEELVKFFNEKDERIYIMEEYIDGELISFDGIANSKSEPVFYSNEVFLSQVLDVVTDKKDMVYYSNKECPKDLYDAGSRVLKAFKVQKRWFHLEFFRLKSDKVGLGSKGDIIGLETNMRAPGGYTPDVINYSKSANTYKIFADIMMNDVSNYDNSFKKFYTMYAAQNFSSNYSHSRDDILAKYKSNIVMHDFTPAILADDMGDESFVANFDDFKDALEFKNYVIAKK